jgi:ABC-type amino acid transport substrate-binding protein
MMRRIWPVLLIGLLLIGAGLQAQDTVPTLVPPTPVPTRDAGLDDALAAESALARIRAEGVVRVGTLFNAPPFGLLNIRGEVAGFDADLARSMAALWDVEVEFVQVTRQTAFDMLRSGTVDLLAAALVHERDHDALAEFSHTYYRGSQAMLVRVDDGAVAPAEMAGRRVGAVIGTRAERAVNSWRLRTGIDVAVQTFLTLDQAYVALVSGEIDGLVASRYRLRDILQPEQARLLDEEIMPEPYAIAVRRQDVGLRNLVNRSLQFLAQNGRLNEIYGANFPGSSYPAGLIPVWQNLGDDAPRPEQFDPAIRYPTQPVVPRLQGGGALRVAGLSEPPPDAVASEARFYALNRALADALAARWGVPVEYVPDSAANALELVAGGAADLAVGVELDWNWADQVDFAGPYLLHGDRMLVRRNSSIESFNDLRGGRWVGIFASEPGSADQVNQLAESVNSAVNIYTMVREQDVHLYLLEEENADVAFGDSLKLIPHVQAYPDDLRLTARCPGCDPWYTRIYTGIATPQNDIDFRLLVEYTLQEMMTDGSLADLLAPVMLAEDVPQFDIWPGPASYLGFNLVAAGAAGPG